MTGSRGRARDRAVQSVDRAVSVLQILAVRGPCGVTEIAGQLGVHKTTVFRLIATTTFGSGVYGLTLPVTAKSGQRWTLSGILTDTGTQSYDVQAVVNGGSTFEEILAASNSFGPGNWQHNSELRCCALRRDARRR